MKQQLQEIEEMWVMGRCARTAQALIKTASTSAPAGSKAKPTVARPSSPTLSTAAALRPQVEDV